MGRASPFPSFGQNPKEQQFLRGVPFISTSQTKRTKQKIFAVSLWNRPLVGARSLLQLQISFNFRFRTTATTLHRFLHTWYQNTRTFCTIWSYTFHTFFTSDGRIERFFSETLSINKLKRIFSLDFLFAGNQRYQQSKIYHYLWDSFSINFRQNWTDQNAILVKHSPTRICPFLNLKTKRIHV